VAYNAPAARYLEVEVLNRSPEWLVPLTYEHAIAALRRMAIRFDSSDVAGIAKDQDKALRLIGDLLGSLDHSKGGRIASDLAALYSYALTEMHRIVRTRDKRTLERLTAMLSNLHDAWVQAAEQVAPKKVKTG
jgi:flagellar secretion chaperone FliS